jgi:aspartate racemase
LENEKWEMFSSTVAKLSSSTYPSAVKTLGLIGGIGPESTIEYYRLIVNAYRERNPKRAYPLIIVNSINLQQYLDWINANEMEKFAAGLVESIQVLERAGADFGALCSNTPHIVFDELQRRSHLPLISIIEATCERVQQFGIKKIGLFGTRFTMQGHFYPDVFSRAGIELITPNEAEQSFIHDKYMNELLNDMFLPATREQMLDIADKLRARAGIEDIILGGTELPLLLSPETFTAGQYNGIRFFDTTRIHVDRLVEELLK